MNVWAANRPFTFTINAIATACANCAGGDGITPSSFLFTSPGASFNVHGGAGDITYYVWTFNPTNLIQNTDSSCHWGDQNDVLTEVGQVERTVTVNGVQTSHAFFPIYAAVVRGSATDYTLSLENAGGDPVLTANATTTGCIAADFAGYPKDPATLDSLSPNALGAHIALPT